MLKRNSTLENDWKRQNLVRYNPSGKYYIRARVAGKLHKSLETPVLTIARQRLVDELRKLRAHSLSVTVVGKGKMSMADAIAIYRDRLASNNHIKPRTRAYYEEVLAALLKSWPTLVQADPKRVSEGDCPDWSSRFFGKALTPQRRPLQAT
jgi:hypothetical protein